MDPTDEERREMIRNEIRKERNELLAKSDWTQLPDNALSEEQKRQWITYRKQLRDLPPLVNIQSSYVTTFNSITWPVEPDRT